MKVVGMNRGRPIVHRWEERRSGRKLRRHREVVARDVVVADEVLHVVVIVHDGRIDLTGQRLEVMVKWYGLVHIRLHPVECVRI